LIMQQMRREDPRVSRTCVFFHAHPDDEALLTGGTMAGLAAQGHRVVLVVATAGENGLSETSVASRLGKVRAAELDASAAVLGCARVHHLGYADSGLDGRAAPCPGSPPPFAQVPVSEAAAAVAGILREEHADLITGYDAAGGYGHPDHLQVHHVAAEAARLAGIEVLLEATVDRALLLRALRLIGAVYPLPAGADARALANAYAPPEAITQRINVRPWARAKRAALAAHASQTTGGDTLRTVAALSALPLPLFRRILGVEWYIRRTPSEED